MSYEISIGRRMRDVFPVPQSGALHIEQERQTEADIVVDAAWMMTSSFWCEPRPA